MNHPPVRCVSSPFVRSVAFQSLGLQTEWDVKKILAERMRVGKIQYLVEWLDLQPNGQKWPNSWEDSCSDDLIAEWEKFKASKQKRSCR